MFDLNRDREHLFDSNDAQTESKDPVVQYLAKEVEKSILRYRSIRDTTNRLLRKYPIGHKDHDRIFRFWTEREREAELSALWKGYVKSKL